jgi:hypothetical protein
MDPSLARGRLATLLAFARGAAGQSISNPYLTLGILARCLLAPRVVLVAIQVFALAFAWPGRDCPSQARGRGLPPAWRASPLRLWVSVAFLLPADCSLSNAGLPTSTQRPHDRNASPQADLAFVSAFPGEKEVLYPPLTHLEPTCKSQKLHVHSTHTVSSEYEVYEVKVSIG